jgi:hypothetical protein
MEPTKQSNPVSLYNPLSEDFSCKQADDDNVQHTYTIRSLEIETYPKYIADHITKHLAQAIIAKRGIKTNYEDAYKEAVEEMTVEY